MGPASALVTGANRGIGLGLCRALVAAGTRPIAVCRDPDRAQELRKLGENVTILKLDLLDFASYDGLAAEVMRLTGGSGLNLLINNAGVSPKFTTLQYVKREQLVDGYAVNTIAPILLTKSLLPALKTAAQANPSKMGVHRAAILNMSSTLGSIAANDRGGFYPYRCSKAALNAATRSMSIDLKKDGIVAVSMHPGWVKTDMGGANAPLNIEDSVIGIMETLKNIRPEDSGKFFQYDGTELPW